MDYVYGEHRFCKIINQSNSADVSFQEEKEDCKCAKKVRHCSDVVQPIVGYAG